MPELSFDRTEAVQASVDAILSVKRGLTLVPNDSIRREAVANFEGKGIRVFGREDIEDSLDPFTKCENSVLVLANSYDGIDLPDDSCRLLILMGLPVGTNLQESFLLTRLAATSLLRDRMLTRFTQGVGRCTRSDRDFSAVLLLDRNLIDFVLRSENRKVMHPELQAELQFGMENSEGKTRQDFVALVQAQLQQGEAWSRAERAILNLRARKVKEEDQIAKRLKPVASDEVDFVYALWTGNLEKALEKARAVSDRLGGNETKGYRGWWYYLAGDVALQMHESAKSVTSLQIAKDYFAKAATCSLSISWFADLARLTLFGTKVATVDELTPLAVEQTRDRLIELGLTGQRFEQQMAMLLSEVSSNEHDTFQRGLKTLGDFLGFDSIAPTSTADPDCVWSIDHFLHVAHEVKVEHTPGGEIGANDVRQAASHANWVNAKCACSNQSKILCVIESPRELVEAGALPHANNLFYANPTTVQELANELVMVLRSVRAASPTMPDESLLEALREELGKKNLLPTGVVERLTRQPLSKMAVSRRKEQ